MGIFRNFDTTTRWTTRILWVAIAANAIAAVSDIAEYRLIVDIAGGSVDYDVEAATDRNDFRQLIVAVLHNVIWIAAAVSSLVWIRQANLNARILGATDMRFTPNWSIGWYFIPVMNLWKPYQAMTEIWRASGRPGADQPASAPGTLQLWWVAWIALIGLDRLSRALARRADHLEDFRIASLAAIAVDAAGIVLCFAFMDVIKEISYRQAACAAALGSAAPASA